MRTKQVRGSRWSLQWAHTHAVRRRALPTYNESLQVGVTTAHVKRDRRAPLKLA